MTAGRCDFGSCRLPEHSSLSLGSCPALPLGERDPLQAGGDPVPLVLGIVQAQLPRGPGLSSRAASVPPSCWFRHGPEYRAVPLALSSLCLTRPSPWPYDTCMLKYEADHLLAQEVNRRLLASLDESIERDREWLRLQVLRDGWVRVQPGSGIAGDDPEHRHGHLCIEHGEEWLCALGQEICRTGTQYGCQACTADSPAVCLKCQDRGWTNLGGEDGGIGPCPECKESEESTT